LSRSELARFRQRFRNHVHNQILTLFLDLQEGQKLSQKAIATRLNVDPSRINRLLNDPANMTLDTVSDLMLAMNAQISCKTEHFHQALTDRVTPSATSLLRHSKPDTVWISTLNTEEVKSALPARENEPANDDSSRQRNVL
jgi:transcriptional regulator with XRE-family HTH domain